MVESNNLMPNIKRRSKQNAPNEAWVVALHSCGIAMSRVSMVALSSDYTTT